MYFAESKLWLVKARDYAYERRPAQFTDTPLPQFPWREVAGCVKDALNHGGQDASHLKISIGDIDKQQMGLMFLTAQALVPFMRKHEERGVRCDTRTLDVFNMAAEKYGPNGRNSPLQRRVLGASFFAKDVKMRSERKNTMASQFSMKKGVTMFEKTLYLSFVIQPWMKSRVKSNRYRFSRTNQDRCQRLGGMIGLIVDAFNLFAWTCSFDDVETMISSSLLWNKSNLKYEVIATRNEGYAPKTQRYRLSSSIGASVDIAVVEETAISLSDERDSGMRKVTENFLEELVLYVLDPNLIEAKFELTNAFGHQYFSHDEGNNISPRLMGLRTEIMEQFHIPPAVLQEWESCDEPFREDTSGETPVTARPRPGSADVDTTSVAPSSLPSSHHPSVQTVPDANITPSIPRVELPSQHADETKLPDHDEIVGEFIDLALQDLPPSARDQRRDVRTRRSKPRDLPIPPHSSRTRS